MKGSANTGKISPAEARAALERVLASGMLESSPKLARFLRFIMMEELAGRGEAINPHAIAVEALDRPESFDPKTDPLVRVFASRLRTALNTYYQGAGREDPVHISISKGSYRPSLRVSKIAQAQKENSLPAMARVLRTGRGAVLSAGPAYWFAGLIAVAAMVGAFAVHLMFHGWHAGQDEMMAAVTSETPMDMPVVEVLPFDYGADRNNYALIEGIRQQLIYDLSQFRSLKVRVVAAFGATGTN
jgi:hypothetical protein